MVTETTHGARKNSQLSGPGPHGSLADMAAIIGQVVSDNKAQVISVSLGECESSAHTDGTMAAVDNLFAMAVVLRFSNLYSRLSTNAGYGRSVFQRMADGSDAWKSSGNTVNSLKLGLRS